MNNSIIFSLVILSGLGICGCGKNTSQVRSGPKQPVSAFKLTVYSDGHDTSVQINGEPVGYSPSLFWPDFDDRDIIVRGFPIHSGTNLYSFTTTPDLPANYPMQVMNLFLMSFSQESKRGIVSPWDWHIEDMFTNRSDPTNSWTWDADFEISQDTPDPGFELLGAKTNVYTQQACSFAVKLAWMFREQDEAGLASALSLEGKEAVLTNCTGFLVKQLTPGTVSVAGVTNVTEVNADIGPRSILVYPSDQDRLAEVSFLRGKVRKRFFLDYVRFTRLNGKWKVALPGSEFFDLNLPADSVTNELPK